MMECGILAKKGKDIRDQDASFKTLLMKYSYVKFAFQDKVVLSK